MKKAITFLSIILLVVLSTQAQKKETPKEKVPTVLAIDTLQLPATVKIVVIDSVNFSIQVLKEYAAAVKQNKFPVYATAQWIADSYKFFRTAGSPGTNDIQMELLKAPLIPWLQYFDTLTKEQKK